MLKEGGAIVSTEYNCNGGDIVCSVTVDNFRSRVVADFNFVNGTVGSEIKFFTRGYTALYELGSSNPVEYVPKW